MFYSYSSSDHAARSDARSAQSTARNNSTEVQYLKSEVERLLMISEALWEFIKKDKGYEDQDLFDKVLEIDAKDGRIDGKVAPEKPKKCPECSHTLPRRKPFCIYCGLRIAKDCFER
jgi:hypothetical protein